MSLPHLPPLEHPIAAPSSARYRTNNWQKSATVIHPTGSTCAVLIIYYCKTPRAECYWSWQDFLKPREATKGAERSDNPWHVYEYKPHEFEALCKKVTPNVEMFGLWHANKLRIHELAIRHAGWDTVHKRLRFTKPFYDRFI
ncbi:MAG: hypothetical protein H7240_05150, partial [Glaciimonas sp.]|nr:hypothetical protein [Glaciimonas sp.]